MTERMGCATIAVSLTVAAVVMVAAAAVASSTAPEHIRSWSEAVWNGTIEGDAAYYYNGEATPDEYHHALITATNKIAADQWVYPNHWTVANNTPMVDPTAFCPDLMCEYNISPGAGYWPQLFADDSDRYDALVMFDDFYGPVVYLWPQAGRVYEHPAGGYDSYIVCWTRNAA